MSTAHCKTIIINLCCFHSNILLSAPSRAVRSVTHCSISSNKIPLYRHTAPTAPSVARGTSMVLAAPISTPPETSYDALAFVETLTSIVPRCKRLIPTSHIHIAQAQHDPTLPCNPHRSMTTAPRTDSVRARLTPISPITSGLTPDSIIGRYPETPHTRCAHVCGALQ
jgi:hypothetical protein